MGSVDQLLMEVRTNDYEEAGSSLKRAKEGRLTLIGYRGWRLWISFDINNPKLFLTGSLRAHSTSQELKFKVL